MRAVIDTNLLVGALARRGGAACRILERWRAGAFEHVASEATLREAELVVGARWLERLAATRVRDDLLAELRARSIIVEAPVLSKLTLKDAGDRRLVEAAHAGKARYPVTSDREVLRMWGYAGVEFVTSGEFSPCALWAVDLPGAGCGGGARATPPRRPDRGDGRFYPAPDAVGETPSAGDGQIRRYTSAARCAMTSAVYCSRTADAPRAPNSARSPSPVRSRCSSAVSASTSSGGMSVSPTRALYELDVGAAPRRDHRDAAGHRLDQGQALRIIVGRRHGEHVEPLEKRHLVVKLQHPPVVDLPVEAPLPNLPHHPVQVRAVLRTEIAGQLQPAALQIAPLAQAVVGVAEQVDPLLRRDASEVADRERTGFVPRRRRITVGVDTERDDVQLRPGNAQVLAPCGPA